MAEHACHWTSLKAQRDPYGEVVRFLAQHCDKNTIVFFKGVAFARQSTASAPSSLSVTLDPLRCIQFLFGGKTIVEYDVNNREGG
ncbi:hypothetical protein [Dongia sp. agr-C8]